MGKRESLEFTVEEVHNILYALAFYAENSTGNLNREVEATVLKVQSLVELAVEDGRLTATITRPFTFLAQR